MANNGLFCFFEAQMFCCQKYKVWSAWGGGGKSESKYKDWRRMEFAKYPGSNLASTAAHKVACSKIRP